MDVAAAARVGGREGMGATLTAVHLSGRTAYVVEVGDSRAYLLRGGDLLLRGRSLAARRRRQELLRSERLGRRSDGLLGALRRAAGSSLRFVVDG